MSERTTIGGTVYESIGSSSSNLLLKCNGTARIQWGSRLIDLIKNGKIASGDSSSSISVISDESEIKSDGVYVLTKDESLQLLICKDDEQYNITNADLYISAKTKQDITVEQRQQALENIGMYYNTLDDVRQAGIQNGLVYVLSDQNLYTIKDGIVTEFEAKLKTVTVEKEQQEGEIIKSNVRIILSVADTDYIVVGEGKILVNYPLVIKDSASLESEHASDERGYRLYIDNEGSHLDVDYLNVRTGIPFTEYTEVTYEEFYTQISTAQLKPHSWYLITDYKNPWKVAGGSASRPILIRALTESEIYPEGKLFKDQRVIIEYDPHYREEVLILDSDPEAGSDSSNVVFTKGRILRMQDASNNVANFDFLDYTDVNGTPLATLHSSEYGNVFDASIFPKGSYNNTLTVNNLKGITLVNKVFDNTSTGVVDFQFKDFDQLSEDDMSDSGSASDDEIQQELEASKARMLMHDNVITCSSLILQPDCAAFYGNTIEETSDNIVINTNVINSSFKLLSGVNIHCSFTNVSFKNVNYCTFGMGHIEDLVVSSNLNNLLINKVNYPLLYDASLSKEAYISKGQLQIVVKKEQTFFRGMIVMYSGALPVPEGWAICDGQTVTTLEGTSFTTPNLVGKFIKATSNPDSIGDGVQATFTLTEDHLPRHSHPHAAHSHTITGSASIPGEGILMDESSKDTTSILVSGSSSSVTSVETTKTWKNAAFTIEPAYYSLIFIIKL